ncbi:CU044_2847 family protein [Dactylosporangium sp. NPDC049525]|uniref:CU044_2847 family protein n=1 Tax=Dactylosporangium sp. NPDC049525 TaxID=3154730 RepID=UPI0034353BB5
MGSQVVTYSANGVAVSFEIEPVAGFVPAAAPGDLIGRVREALEPAVGAAREVLEQVRKVAPDRVEVKFGVKVTGTMNWLVAKAASEGNFEVTLAWEPEPPAGSAPSA